MAEVDGGSLSLFDYNEIEARVVPSRWIHGNRVAVELLPRLGQVGHLAGNKYLVVTGASAKDPMAGMSGGSLSLFG